MQEKMAQLLKISDSNTIAELYNTYGPALYGIVLRIVYSKEVAQQVIQDTFVKAWRSAANYDESKGRVFTWLLNIARNTAIDATRTPHFRNSAKTESIDVLMHAQGDCTFNPNTLGLREAVQKMDEKYKKLIDLIYFKGHTHESASEETGLPIGTIKTRVRYAILELRKTFC